MRKPVEKEIADETRETSDDQVFHQIYNAIYVHDLPPGTKLKEEQLAKIFGVGRTRLRKTLFRLADLKVLTFVPNKGAFVSEPTAVEAREVFDARRMVESHIVRTLANASDASIPKKLDRQLAKEHEARTNGDLPTVIRECGNFHLMLAELAGLAVLGEFLHELVSRTSLICMLYERGPPENCEFEEHRDLVKAIAEGRGDDAAGLMEVHLAGIENRLDLSPRKKKVVDLKSVLSVK